MQLNVFGIELADGLCHEESVRKVSVDVPMLVELVTSWGGTA